MAQDKPAGALYDFLYRDSGRIASYYAQIFNGRLSSLTETNTEQSGAEFGGKLDVKIASGDAKSTSGVQTSKTRVIEPHDVITNDVLSYLIENEHVAADVANAPHGSLVLAEGTVVFADKSMGELALIAFREIIRAEESKPKSQRNQEELQLQKLTATFFEKVIFPSGFFLGTEDGHQIVGVIKEEGMEEPIPSYYFKHGTSGLTGVFLIGIKEVPTKNFTLPSTQLIGVGQLAAQAMSDVLFPPEAIRVTPIALFRNLT